MCGRGAQALGPAAVVALGLFGAAGCVEADLGSSPFYCNPGSPKCPTGYFCLSLGSAAKAVCVKEGTKVPQLDGGVLPKPDVPRKQDKGPVVKKDGPGVKHDQGAQDLGRDMYQPPKPDLRPPPDMYVFPDTNGTSPIICFSNADCKDKARPCCCKVQLVPVKTCLSFCLDPFCLPL